MQPAFADPPTDSARAFRAIMQAMARPGTVHEVAAPAPEGLSPAAAATLLVLADQTTPVWLAHGHDWLVFHTGAPVAATRAEAAFAVGPWDALAPLGDWPVGTPDYPDRSTTLIVEVPRLDGSGTRLTGPGIETESRLPLPDARALAANAALYPLGVDLILSCGDRLAALPRSTRIHPEDA
ncbi:phosphonate C-P lyase system protein PhnH [Jannaschia formosa]|uniref:phosphonate C-P lyase system protein PhnH n=1 Tax=Jannaschia formosa TaxID=2259592 RepID=UPI000E1C1FFB|nr:phosphonate C-P lyase system protein PhnH [Jannaschia formosa]TFL17714.1 phosphonate C-P lyase system protein PhnH [Jannaschia formosa]